MSFLQVTRAATRTQIAAACGFTSSTRSHVRLTALVRDGYLAQRFLASPAGTRQSVFMLPESRIRSRHGPAGFAASVQHQIALSEAVVASMAEDQGNSLTWKTPMFFKDYGIIPDAVAVIQKSQVSIACLLEIDLATEGVSVWTNKVRRYIALAQSGTVARQLEADRFRVLVLTTSNTRLAKLARSTSELTTKIFWFATFADIKQEGFFGQAWQRPAGSEKSHLM